MDRRELWVMLEFLVQHFYVVNMVFDCLWRARGMRLPGQLGPLTALVFVLIVKYVNLA